MTTAPPPMAPQTAPDTREAFKEYLLKAKKFKREEMVSAYLLLALGEEKTPQEVTPLREVDK